MAIKELKTKETAALTPEEKAWANSFASFMKTQGLIFDKSFVRVTQRSILHLTTRGPLKGGYLPAVQTYLNGRREDYTIDINKALMGSHKYWSLSKVAGNGPEFLTMDELYGSIYIQF